MNKITLKTNLKCQGCMDKLEKEFKKVKEISDFKADLSSSDKEIEVETTLTKEQIIEIIEKTGYKAE